MLRSPVILDQRPHMLWCHHIGIEPIQLPVGNGIGQASGFHPGQIRGVVPTAVEPYDHGHFFHSRRSGGGIQHIRQQAFLFHHLSSMCNTAVRNQRTVGGVAGALPRVGCGLGSGLRCGSRHCSHSGRSVIHSHILGCCACTHPQQSQQRHTANQSLHHFAFHHLKQHPTA